MTDFNNFMTNWNVNTIWKDDTDWKKEAFYFNFLQQNELKASFSKTLICGNLFAMGILSFLSAVGNC